jgi:hypothetical protein
MLGSARARLSLERSRYSRRLWVPIGGGHRGWMLGSARARLSLERSRYSRRLWVPIGGGHRGWRRSVDLALIFISLYFNLAGRGFMYFVWRRKKKLPLRKDAFSPVYPSILTGFEHARVTSAESPNGLGGRSLAATPPLRGGRHRTRRVICRGGRGGGRVVRVCRVEFCAALAHIFCMGMISTKI